MRTFLKIVFGSCLGMIIAMILLFVILAIIGSSLSSSFSGEKEVSLESKSILKLDFSKPMPDKTNNVESSPLSLENNSVVGLIDAIKLIKHAATDKNIEGIYINPGSGVNLGMSGIKDISSAIQEFKKSGKFVYAYGESLSQGGYYLCSNADKIFLNPMGDVSWHGMGTMIMYFKNLMDKLDIKMNVFYVGKFKSATEPFRSDKMSDANRLQLKTFINEYYNQIVNEVAKNRKLDPSTLKQLANDLAIQTAEDALQYKFIDQIAYEDQVFKAMKDKVKVDEKEKLNLVSLNEYYDATTLKNDYSASNKVALVYAEGTIDDSNDNVGKIGGKSYVKILRKLRYDKDVKAVILRVNSPGGSAYASEQIWHEIEMLKQSGKKVVVSMGDLAASGGYYISCNADKIFASPATITGSIGVFGMIPDMSGFFKNKLYITADSVKTGPNSLPINTVIPMTPDQRNSIQSMVENTYKQFVDRVSKGRKLPVAVVDSLAQGHIYSGKAALDLKLVDQLGNLNDAIVAAASMSGVKEYRIVTYPETPSPLKRFLDELTGKNNENTMIQTAVNAEIKQLAPEYLEAKEIFNSNKIQTRLPFVLKTEM